MRHELLLLCSLLSVGCATERATQFSVPKERANECMTNCAALDMKLAAVVIIKSSAGCVCEPQDAQARTSSGAAAVAIGAMLAVEEEAQQQRQRYR
ncbi:hypothetical protein [Archangium sp.]|uniref:hypothetical protein n=1 Tax=Archangium sp. TaxID=1872627 RepID=UPI002D4A1B10|nr:hypothetical protein [Archangium sp.]HYO54100.1 hypothetical protein [Archangium sp.]